MATAKRLRQRARRTRRRDDPKEALKKGSARERDLFPDTRKRNRPARLKAFARNRAAAKVARRVRRGNRS